MNKILENLKNNVGKIFIVLFGVIVIIAFYLVETSKSQHGDELASEVEYVSEEAVFGTNICDSYSDEQKKQIKIGTVISKEDIKQYVSKLSEILKSGNNNVTKNYINEVDLTNENGVSLEYLEDYPNKVYLNNELYTGVAYKEHRSDKFACIEGWYCDDGDYLNLESWRVTNFVNGKIEGQRVLFVRDKYDSSTLKLIHLGNYKNGKSHGNTNLYDSRGKITTNAFYLEGSRCHCTGDACDKLD